MYKNLLAEIARIGLTRKELAKKVEIKPETLYKKINGKTEFTLSEIKKLLSLFDNVTFEYLFEV